MVVASLVLSAMAAVGAAVALWAWWTTFRSRPEVAFEWLKPNGRDEPWPVDEAPSITPGKPYRVHIEIHNIGTGSISPLIVNFVAPDWVDLKDLGVEKTVLHDGEEVAVGNPSGDRCHWIARTITAFSPAVPVRFEVEFLVVAGGNPSGTTTFFVGCSVEGDRFNATGQLIGLALADDPARELWKQREWPGNRYRRQLRKVQARPFGNLRIGPGKRLDRRPVKIEQDRATVEPVEPVESEEPRT